MEISLCHRALQSIFIPGAPELPAVHLSPIPSQADLFQSTKSLRKQSCGTVIIVGCITRAAVVLVIIVAMAVLLVDTARMSTSADAAAIVSLQHLLVAIIVVS